MRFSKIFITALLILLTSGFSFAQCPIPSNCTPGSAPSASFIFGMGIYQVIIGSISTGLINTSTYGAQDGYKDYSCTKQVTISEGTSTAISIRTNQNANENVRVWLDMNNNGIFDPVNELIFTSNNARQHNGSFTIPVNPLVSKNTILRLRVSSDNVSSAIPTPCSTPQFGQVEDYGLTILASTTKPAVDFIADKPVTCSPTVQFQQLVQNGVISYLWNFGDNTTSTVADPSHTYATTGTYTVSLIACNAFGCDTLTKTNYITYHNNIPVTASCSPATTNYCCGYGITNFTISTLNNSSANASAGYEDFTCSKSITLQENATYPISIASGTNNSQDIWVYIDYNNDGNFTAGELLISRLGTLNFNTNVTIPAGGTLNTPLRMRVISDATGNSANVCANRTNGQVEDYTIIITPNTQRPILSFTSNKNSACDTLVQFTDNSYNVPTSWIWDFGDGSPVSTLQNPQHEYQNSGFYTVKLIACNTNGCDTLTKINYMLVTKPCQTYCLPINKSNPSWISNVLLANLNHTSGPEPTTYSNYTNFYASVIKGNSYPFTVSTGGSVNRSVTTYIDYNQDGDFLDKGEKIKNGGTNSSITVMLTVPNNVKTGLTRMRIMLGGSTDEPCVANGYIVETEDYTLHILPNNLPPVAAFFTNGTISCSRTISFSDTSAHTPTSWLWSFNDNLSGSSNNSTLQNPSHTFSKNSNYTISLTVCNSFGCNTITKTNYISITNNSGPRSVACIQNTIYPNNIRNGIYNVTINTINYSPPFNNGYKDFSCTQQTTLPVGVNTPISIKTDSHNNIKVWIDYNNDGAFDPVTEVVLSALSNGLLTGSITPPLTAVRNKPLRMRIANDRGDRIPPSVCNPLYNGQAVDFAVTITGTVSGISDQNLMQQINIYPNPNNGKFFLELPEALNRNYNLKIIDLVGKTVFTDVLNNDELKVHEIDPGQLSNGIYLIKISNQYFSTFRKIIVD